MTFKCMGCTGSLTNIFDKFLGFFLLFYFLYFCLDIAFFIAVSKNSINTENRVKRFLQYVYFKTERSQNGSDMKFLKFYGE